MTTKYGTKNVIINIIWKLGERAASLATSLVVTFVLARLLNPADFGLLSIVEVFVLLTQIFVTGGLANALVQKKNADELDFSSVFWLNVTITIILYTVFYTLSPVIARFYDYPQMTSMLRVLSINLLFASIHSIQGAYVAKKMMFRHYFYSTLTGKVLSGVIGIVMALMGFGVWALISQSLSLIAIECIVLWFRVKWRPRFIFSATRAKELWAFAWRVLVMNFVEQFNNQFRKMFIGKKYLPEELAFYSKGALLPTTIITNITTSLSSVMFPVLSEAQDEREKSLALCRKWVSLFAYCSLPLLFGMVFAAKELIVVLMTSKWLFSIPYLQLACAVYAAWIIEMPIRETIKSFGFSKITLRVQIIKAVFALCVLLTVMNHGVFMIAAAVAASSLFNIAVSAFYGKKYAGYRYSMLIADVFPALLLSGAMGVCVYLVGFVNLVPVLMLIVKAMVGLVVYIAISKISKNEDFAFLLNLLSGMIRKNRNSKGNKQ